MKIKVCGMKYLENIQEIAALQPDYLGFIFYKKSPRYVGDPVKEIFDAVPEGIKRTGVFVLPDIARMLQLGSLFSLHTIQLHGSQPPEQCKELREEGYEVIKAFGVDEPMDFSRLEPYLEVADYFLFDVRNKDYGGTGEKFNWDILKEYPYHKPFFLSGGIGPGDEERLRDLPHSALVGLDLNSRFENVPGLKDVQAVKTFMENIRKNEIQG